MKCKGNTQITHMDETEKRHRVIRLMSLKLSAVSYIRKNVTVAIQEARKYSPLGLMTLFRGLDSDMNVMTQAENKQTKERNI